jgi:hypothetical protein
MTTFVIPVLAQPVRPKLARPMAGSGENPE